MKQETRKAAIASRDDAECNKLAARLTDFHYDQWDEEMAQDFTPGGRGATLVARVRAEATGRKSKR